MTTISALTLHTASRTHVGLIRPHNEDALYTGRHLNAVADGLGGHVAGEVASTTVIDSLKAADHSHESTELAAVLSRAVYAANEALRRAIAAQTALAGMGTTLVAMLWAGTSAVVANVGDSRAYLLRARGSASSALVRVTDDHTYGRLVAAASDVPNLPERLARFLDGRADGRSPDITNLDLKPGDRVLLCSDGLTAAVDPDAIHATLDERGDTEHAVERLVALALAGGGPDNITVVVSDVVAGD